MIFLLCPTSLIVVLNVEFELFNKTCSEIIFFIRTI
jgi:hypothetical protein